MFPLKGCLTDYKDARSIRPYCWETRTAAQTQVHCASLFLHHLAVKRGFRTQRLFVEAPYMLDWGTPISGKSFINSFPKINHYKLRKDLIFSTVLHTSAAPDLLQEKSINIDSSSDFTYTFDFCRSINIRYTGTQVL